MDYTPNPNWKRNLGRSAGLKRLAHRVAEQRADEVRRIIRAEAYASGALFRSVQPFVTEEDGFPVGGASVGTDHWAVVEFGSAHNRTVAPLRRANSKKVN